MTYVIGGSQMFGYNKSNGGSVNVLLFIFTERYFHIGDDCL